MLLLTLVPVSPTSPTETPQVVISPVVTSTVESTVIPTLATLRFLGGKEVNHMVPITQARTWSVLPCQSEQVFILSMGLLRSCTFRLPGKTFWIRLSTFPSRISLRIGKANGSTSFHWCHSRCAGA